MSKPKCARCKRPEAEHPEPMTPAEALAWPQGGVCHRFEPKAPLWMRVIDR